MREKLDMRNHKAILSVTLFVFLIIALIFADYIVASGGQLLVLLFGIVFVLFVTEIITISILIRTRDELHAMHEENRQQFHALHERIKPTVRAKRRG